MRWRLKLFAHGPQDLVDAEYALAVAGPDFDLGLLRELADTYGPETAAALERLLQRHHPEPRS